MAPNLAFIAALPLAFYFLLLELVAGTLAAQVLTDLDREVPIGFHKFMSVSILLTLLLTAWAHSLLPAHVAAAAGPDLPLLWLGVALTAVYTVFTFRDRPGLRIASGTIGTVALAVALGLGVRGFGLVTPAAPAQLLTIASFGLAAAALGTSMQGMLLGHWYLVAPMLSSAPLIRLNALMLVVVIAQAVVIGIVASGEWAAAVAGLGTVFWIRVLFGIVFPIVMALFIWYSCRIRAMRTATGILYLAIACVLMGDVAAKVLFFQLAVPI